MTSLAVSELTLTGGHLFNPSIVGGGGLANYAGNLTLDHVAVARGRLAAPPGSGSGRCC